MSTLIIIDIRPEANLEEIIECIKQTFGFMPEWSISPNVESGGIPSKGRIYSFDLDNHVFAYWRSNQSYSDTMDNDEVPICDLADISNLLNFIYDNGDKLHTSKPELTEEQKAGMAYFASLFEPPKDPSTAWDNVNDAMNTHGIYISQQHKVKKEDIEPDGTIPVGKLLFDDGTWWKNGGQALKFEPTFKFKLTPNGPEHKIKNKITKEIDKVMSGESDAKDIYEYYAQTQPEP